MKINEINENMTKSEIKTARVMAMDSKIDLSKISDDILHGCSTWEFRPVYVGIQTVAKLLRQYICMDGTFDEKTFNEDSWGLKKNVKIV